MSKISPSRWQNPFTNVGLRITHGPMMGPFQIHEVGTMSLDESWLHRSVCSPFWRLFYEFGRGAWVQCSGRRVNLDSDRLVLLPEGVPFDCGADQKVKHLWLHFSMRTHASMVAPNLLNIPLAKEFRGLIATLRKATVARQEKRANQLGMALLHVAFSNLNAEWLEASSPRLQRVLGWLSQHLEGPITNKHLADQTGLGEVAFIRWFRQATGKTPALYVAERRMQEACRLLALTDRSIESIAESLGYSNRHHFSRVFAQHAGCGPASYRRSGWRPIK